MVMEKAGGRQRVRSVVSRACEDNGRFGWTPARRYLVGHPFGHSLDYFAGGNPLRLDCVAFDGAYLFVGE